MPAKKVAFKKWDVFELPLEGGTHGYGHVLGSVLVGLYGVTSAERLPLQEVIQTSVAFRVQCLTDRLRDGSWPIVGNIEPPPAMNAPVRFWRRTAGNVLYLYEWHPETGGRDRRATEGEIVGVEHEGFWEPRDVEERLKMFLRGEPCPWVKLG